jgi:ATP-dependent phosphoenolpyruvate carboxykinase
VPLTIGGASREQQQNHNESQNMKKTLFSLTCAMLASAALAVDETTTTSTTTTTSSTGTISEYTPGSTFVIKETSGPVKYRYGKSVTYVTKKGKTLSEDEVRTRIKVGIPVSVRYATEGTDRVISRVEVED